MIAFPRLHSCVLRCEHQKSEMVIGSYHPSSSMAWNTVVKPTHWQTSRPLSFINFTMTVGGEEWGLGGGKFPLMSLEGARPGLVASFIIPAPLNSHEPDENTQTPKLNNPVPRADRPWCWAKLAQTWDGLVVYPTPGAKRFPFCVSVLTEPLTSNSPGCSCLVPQLILTLSSVSMRSVPLDSTPGWGHAVG